MDRPSQCDVGPLSTSMSTLLSIPTVSEKTPMVNVDPVDDSSSAHVVDDDAIVGGSFLMSLMLLIIRLHYLARMAISCMICLYLLHFLQIGQSLYLSGLYPLLLIQ
jgi:hypothetical protein